MDGGELLELHCPICYGDQGDSGYMTLICGHIFHEKCLTQSLRIKKECPSCRCPARPLDMGRRDATSQPKCPCKTGQPLRLFHLQRPRSVASAISLSQGQGGAAVDSAALAAAEQRAARLREALQEERERALELEAELQTQLAELVKTQEKAERRKQRLTAMEREHQIAATRMSDDKLRLEARERELTEELARVRQSLHGTRMDLEKARAACAEREDAVMRLKREVALQRARVGGSAALQPREMEELLGERKEDWQAVYSIKVEELRWALEAAAELRAEVARGRADADARVAAERLAGAERVKAVAQERDDVKRELMELEYKLHEADRRLSEMQAGTTATATAAAKAVPANAQGTVPATATTAGLAARVVKQQPQQQPQKPATGLGVVAVVGVEGDDDEGDLEALALEAMGYVGDSQDEEEERTDGDGVGAGDGAAAPAGAAGRDEDEEVKRRARGRSGLGATARGLQVGPDEDEGASDSTPLDLAAVDADANAPPSKRLRHIGSGGDGEDEEMYGVDDLLDVAEPVPLLPRAFSGLFSGGGAAGAGGRPPPPPMQGQPGFASARTAAAGGGALGNRAAGMAFGVSFASKADGARWAQGRGGLIGEGADGSGGSSRCPLISSSAHNAGAQRKATAGKATGRGGGGGNRPGGGSGGAPQGRIDAFLRPVPLPPRR